MSGRFCDSPDFGKQKRNTWVCAIETANRRAIRSDRTAVRCDVLRCDSWVEKAHWRTLRLVHSLVHLLVQTCWKRLFGRSDLCLTPFKSRRYDRCHRGGKWRRGWDSNPRSACTDNGFRDRPDRPLWHLSAKKVFGLERWRTIHRRFGLHKIICEGFSTGDAWTMPGSVS